MKRLSKPKRQGYVMDVLHWHDRGECQQRSFITCMFFAQNYALVVKPMVDAN